MAQSEVQVCREEWKVPSRIVSSKVEGLRNEWLELEESCAANAVIVVVQRDSKSTFQHQFWNTLQVSEREHANFGKKVVKINHSNDPNTRIEILVDKVQIRAIGAIEAGTCLTFNYNTTEWDMAEPFTDWTTGEKVQGFSHLPSKEKEMLLATNLVAAHIRQLHAKNMPETCRRRGNTKYNSKREDQYVNGVLGCH